MIIFTAKTIHHSRSLWIPALLLLLIPWLIPFITPTEEEPVIYAPALAQGAWQTLWIVGSLFGIISAANIGRLFETNNINEYHAALGVSNIRRFLSQLLPIWAASCLLGLIPFLICLVGAMPTPNEDKDMWIGLQSQALLLWIVASPIWIAPALALGNRVSSPVATLASLLVFYYGKEGIQYIDMIRRNLTANEFIRNIAEAAWAIGPHLHFADITDRMIFKMGTLPWETTGSTVLYFIGLSVFVVAASSLIPKRRGFKALGHAKIGNKASEKAPLKMGRFQKKRLSNS